MSTDRTKADDVREMARLVLDDATRHGYSALQTGELKSVGGWLTEYADLLESRGPSAEAVARAVRLLEQADKGAMGEISRVRVRQALAELRPVPPRCSHCGDRWTYEVGSSGSAACPKCSALRPVPESPPEDEESVRCSCEWAHPVDGHIDSGWPAVLDPRCELHSTKEGDVLREGDLLGRAVDALIWCSGSDDFNVGGKARVGWLKLAKPVIDEWCDLHGPPDAREAEPESPPSQVIMDSPVATSCPACNDDGGPCKLCGPEGAVPESPPVSKSAGEDDVIHDSPNWLKGRRGGEVDPHPRYGPCDGFGPDGECSECTGIVERADGSFTEIHATAPRQVGAKPVGGDEFTVPVSGCARCGLDHAAVRFKKFARPAGEWTHWGLCPGLGEPVLNKIVLLHAEPVGGAHWSQVAEEFDRYMAYDVGERVYAPGEMNDAVHAEWAGDLPRHLEALCEFSRLTNGMRWIIREAAKRLRAVPLSETHEAPPVTVEQVRQFVERLRDHRVNDRFLKDVIHREGMYGRAKQIERNGGPASPWDGVAQTELIIAWWELFERAAVPLPGTHEAPPVGGELPEWGKRMFRRLGIPTEAPSGAVPLPETEPQPHVMSPPNTVHVCWCGDVHSDPLTWPQPAVSEPSGDVERTLLDDVLEDSATEIRGIVRALRSRLEAAERRAQEADRAIDVAVTFLAYDPPVRERALAKFPALLKFVTMADGLSREADALRRERDAAITERDRLQRRVDAFDRMMTLCPDHRDKQRGKPCLACTVETLERKLASANTEPDNAMRDAQRVIDERRVER